MKEIKAFIRPECIDPVIHALEDAGFQAMTVIPVQALGQLADPDKARLSTALIERYSSVYKLEIVCHDHVVERALHLIQRMGCTGESGDGIAYVSSVEEAVKIRTGDRGSAAIDTLKAED